VAGMMKISATIITLNEEKNIGDVVDSGSTDRTADICRNYPKVHFYTWEWQGFGKQKNIAAELANNNWVFNIDADERVSIELRASIMAADFSGAAGFRMARENYFGHRWVRSCGWYPDYNLRLYDRRICRFRERSVHEAVECPGAVATLNGNLVHYTYAGISDYLLRIDRYSTLAAEEIVKGGGRPGIASLTLRPVYTFLKMYLLRKGFLEGYLGFLLSVLYSYYTFLKYAKARETRYCRNDGFSSEK
jgi:(heptosyl)LPS beta-1,4-glucosyltransferase